MKKVLIHLIIFLTISSCSPSRNITYFSDLNGKGQYKEEIKNKTSPIIQPDDLISITVSCLNPESNILFNNGILQIPGTTSSSAPTSRANEGYLVNNNGMISFPVLGNIKLGGLTKEEATDKLVEEIRKSVKNPTVNIKFLNFRITVLGEVSNPSTFIVPSERINIMEALGLAGDLTIYGQRENILVIHEKDGIRSTSRLNLTSKQMLDSPSYYLQQNDIVYVEPVKGKALQSSKSTLYLPFVSLVISVSSLLLLVLRR